MEKLSHCTQTFLLSLLSHLCRWKFHFYTAVCGFWVDGQQGFPRTLMQLESLFHFVPLEMIFLSFAIPQTLSKCNHATDWLINYFDRRITIIFWLWMTLVKQPQWKIRCVYTWQLKIVLTHQLCDRYWRCLNWLHVIIVLTWHAKHVEETTTSRNVKNMHER